jgi:ribose 1,5-bisphosphokinase
MSQRLVYVVGPSGAGKDSVMQALRANWSDMPPAHWARRTMTRTAQEDAHMHESVDQAEFERLSSLELFAMSWQANGLSYGIRHTELAPLEAGYCVFVNGSRAYAPQVLKAWSEATVVLITAPADMLARRLQARAREDEQAIANRLSRDVALDLPAQTLCIINDGTIQSAAEQLRTQLRARWMLSADTTS